MFLVSGTVKEPSLSVTVFLHVAMRCYCSARVLIYSLKGLCLRLFILMTDSQERLLMPAGECSDYLIQPRPTAANNSVCFTFLVEIKK